MSIQGNGLQWNELPKNFAMPNLLRIPPEKLQMDFVKKVSHMQLVQALYSQQDSMKMFLWSDLAQPTNLQLMQIGGLRSG
jgi:hypothetical protein